jgi:hypothetical protein
MGLFGLGLPKKVDSPEGRRRQNNAGRLKAEGRHAEARREEKRSHAAWRRDVAAQAKRKGK